MEAKILKPTAVEVKAKSCISVYLFVIAYYKVLKKFRLFENFFGKLVLSVVILEAEFPRCSI